ncbi:hypothetical protein FQN50_004167 [Emmonsiellopsis sp. PD_5]|nr:hypothetical protein FQN50_004167 [Emmonsiellopsis sp. PD_5]
MSNPHLSNEEFFTALKTLLSTQSSAAHGSIFLTQKRLPPTSPLSENASDSSKPCPVLIRASNGKHKSAKSKTSTVVQPDELEGFYLRYAEVCKAGMVGMKKRDRSGKKKGKSKGKGKGEKV